MYAFPILYGKLWDQFCNQCEILVIVGIFTWRECKFKKLSVAYTIDTVPLHVCTHSHLDLEVHVLNLVLHASILNLVGTLGTTVLVQYVYGRTRVYGDTAAPAHVHTRGLDGDWEKYCYCTGNVIHNWYCRYPVQEYMLDPLGTSSLLPYSCMQQLSLRVILNLVGSSVYICTHTESTAAYL